MKKFGIVLIVLSIIGFIYGEVRLASFNIQEVEGEVLSVEPKDTRRVPTYVSKRNGRWSYETYTDYDVGLKVEGRDYTVNFTECKGVICPKVGESIKVVKYTIGQENNIALNKNQVREIEFPISIISLFGLMIGVISFIIGYFKT